MKVLQFAFDSREDSDYLPYRYDKNSVVYTGTHDNSTTFGWWDELAKQDKDVALRYMNRGRFTSRKKLTWDYLCLPNTARINTPSTIGINWQWRMKKGAFDDKLCEKIFRMTKLYGRVKSD